MRQIILLVVSFVLSSILIVQANAAEAAPVPDAFKSNIGQVIGFIKDSAISATQTLKQEVPLFVKELILSKAYDVKVKIWSFSITFLFFLSLFILAIFAVVKGYITGGDAIFSTLFVTGLIVIILFIVGLCKIPDWLSELYKLQHAPRVIIVEYLKAML